MGNFIKNQAKRTRFGMVFLLVSMAAALLTILAFLVFRLSPPLGALSFVVPMAAGMIVGQWHTEDAQSEPTGMDLWQDAFVFAIIGVVVSLMMSVPAAMAPANLALIQDFGILNVIVILAIFYAVSVLAIRFGLGLGMTAAKNKK